MSNRRDKLSKHKKDAQGTVFPLAQIPVREKQKITKKDRALIEAEVATSKKKLRDTHDKTEGALDRFLEDIKALYSFDQLSPAEALQESENRLQTPTAKRYITLIANHAKPESALSDELFRPIMEGSDYLNLRIDPQIKTGEGWIDYLITDPAYGNPIAIELKPLHSYPSRVGAKLIRGKLENDYQMLKKELEDQGKNQIINYLKHHEYVIFTNMEEVYYFNKEAKFNDFVPFEKEDFISFIQDLRSTGGKIWDVVKKKEDKTPKHDLDKRFFVDLKKWFGEFNDVKFSSTIKKEEQIVLLLNKFIFLRTLEDYGLIPYNHTIATYDNSERKWKAKGYAKVFNEFFSDIQQWAYVYYDTELFKESAMLYILQDEENMKRFRVAIEKVLGLGTWDRTFGMGLIHYNYRAIDEDIFGKTYEIFLAEQRQEKGIHYTPSFITETMSENLVKELFFQLRDQLLEEISNQKFDQAIETAKKIISIKVLDPACGSGSFLVKLLRHIWDVYQSIKKNKNIEWAIRYLSDPDDIVERKNRIINIKNLLKLDDNRELIPLIILRHLYGIDLDEKAISVAKVNLWKEAIKLSSRDYRYNTLGGNIDHILPDLEMNMICADSLVDFPVEKSIELLQPFKEEIRNMYSIRDIYLANPFDPSVIEQFVKIKQRIRDELARIFKDTYGSPGGPPLFAPLHFFYCYFGRDGQPFYAEKRGFDGIIGNPPYNVFVESEYFKNLEAHGTGNLFGHFIVKGVNLSATGSAFTFIVPLSFASGSDFENVRRAIYHNYGHLKAAHYSIRPAKLFQGVDQRMTIFIATQKGGSPCVVESSRLYRFTEAEREEIVRHPVMGKAGEIQEEYIPRVADDTGASIYRKFLSVKTKISDFIRKEEEEQGTEWWYHSVGRYWLKAYNFIPFFTRNNIPGVSSKLNSITVNSPEAARACVAVVNSDLLYFWWIIQSDEFDLLPSEVSSMPLPETLLHDANVVDAVNKLMEDYKQKALRKRLRIKGVDIEMDEIHARKSRPFILQIDEILAPHYGLTEEELRFLQEYDSKFRCGEEP